MSLPEWMLDIRKHPLNRAELLHIAHVLWLWVHGLLAVVGALSLALLLYFYVQGLRAVGPLEPTALDAAAEFAVKVLQEDAASALVVSMPLAEGMTPEKAVRAMKKKAEELDIRFIADYPLHQAVREMTNQQVKHAQILEFCDPVVSYSTLAHNPNYLIHMPCRIGLYEDAEGRFHLLTMNLNLLIHGGRDWDDPLKLKALEIQDGLLQIMAAGAGTAEQTP